MKKTLTILLILFGISYLQAQKNSELKNEIIELQKIQSEAQTKLLETQENLRRIEFENEQIKSDFNHLKTLYQQTNDRLDNYLDYTGIIASIFGVLIALAGIYIGFEGLRSQNRRKKAIKTLEEAKAYVNDKKTDFDELVQDKKHLLQKEYKNIVQLLQDKLLNDIEFETSKVRQIAELKSDEIQNLSVEESTNKSIELLERRLEFFESIGIPDDPEILFSKGKLLREKKMHNEAITLFEKLAQKVPEHKRVYWSLGYNYAAIKNNEKSIENYKKHLDLNPDDSSALNNIALRYRTKGNYLEALEYLNKAIESSQKELYYTNRIDTLKLLKSNQKAINDYKYLLTINPEKKLYYESLISLLIQENKVDDVLDYFDKAINQFEESNVELSNHFSFKKASYLGNNKEDELGAIKILQTLIDKSYEIEKCYINIATLKSKIGEADEAILILDNGIKNNPLSSALHLYKALIKSNQNEEDAKLIIDKGGETINKEHFYFTGGRFFNKKDRINLSQYCYEKAFEVLEEKLKEKITEGDIMNYYETNIILQKSLSEFDSNYRKLIISEKYNSILVILGILNDLIQKFDEEEKSKALLKLKELKIESKDKIDWNFEDIYWHIKKNVGDDLGKFTLNLYKYLQHEMEFNELKNHVLS